MPTVGDLSTLATRTCLSVESRIPSALSLSSSVTYFCFTLPVRCDYGNSSLENRIQALVITGVAPKDLSTGSWGATPILYLWLEW